ncbi:MAG: GNAT family N-acetyltransferase [Betaproteobacteria bacterium]
MDFPTKLRTGRLLLTRIERRDGADFFRMRSAPEVTQILGAVDAEQARALCHTLAGHWDDQGYGWWMARAPDSGELLGYGGLRPVMVEGELETELGYGFLPEFWGRGYASELARVAVAQGFVRLAARDLVSYVLPEHHASRRVVEKAGFVCERPLVHARRPHLLYRLKASAWVAAPRLRQRARAEPLLQTA